MKKMVMTLGLLTVGFMVFAAAFFGTSYAITYVATRSESFSYLLNTNFPIFMSTMVATMSMKIVTDKIQVSVW